MDNTEKNNNNYNNNSNNNNNNMNFNEHINENKEGMGRSEIIVPAIRPKIKDEELYVFGTYVEDKIEANVTLIKPAPSTLTYGVLMKANIFASFIDWPKARYVVVYC